MKQNESQPEWNLKALTPALDFHQERAYVTVTIQELKEGSVEDVAYVISSAREQIELTKESLLAYGLYATRSIALGPRPRWSRESIAAFLNEEAHGDLRKAVEYVREQLDYYIDFGEPRWSLVLACWVVGTYFHRLFDSYPYIHLNGNMESGKTKTLRLVSLLAFNGNANVGSTPPYLIRIIHGNHATCCIDEVESLRSARDENSRAVIGMFNAGYKKGAYVGKCDQPTANKTWVTQEFEAYSPKMFAGINGLDPSLGSRCIPITMVRSAKSEITRRDFALDSHDFEGIRDHLYVTLLDCHHAVRGISEGIQETDLVGREWELWKPILAIAKAADPDCVWYDELHAFALDVMRERKETTLQEFLAPKLLMQIEGMFGADTQEIEVSAQAVIDHLIVEDPDSFGWLRDAKRAGRWIGDELRKVGLISEAGTPKKIDGKTVKVYRLSLGMLQQRLGAYQ